MSYTLCTGARRLRRLNAPIKRNKLTSVSWIEPLIYDLPKACQSFPLSPGDFCRSGSGKRNLREARGPRGPSERARASHWAGGEGKRKRTLSIYASHDRYEQNDIGP